MEPEYNPCSWPHVFAFAVIALISSRTEEALLIAEVESTSGGPACSPLSEVGEATPSSLNICLPSLVQMTRPHELLRSWQHASVGRPRDRPCSSAHTDIARHMVAAQRFAAVVVQRSIFLSTFC